MNKAQLLELLKEYDLSSYKRAILSVSQPSVVLRSHRDAASPPPLGASKLAGLPDLPADAQWPMRGERPLDFIGQIHLADLPIEAPIVARGGLLSFFYDVANQPWGFDPADADGSRVVYTPPGATLQRRPLPADYTPEWTGGECGLTPEAHLTLPGIESPEFAALDLEEDELERYEELLEQAAPEEESGAHQFLGYPAEIQGSMELECQLASNGLHCGDGSVYDDPRCKKLKKGAYDWRLLFQVDSDENPGMEWGDAGRLYYWVRAQDLEAMRFDATWLILQCS